MSKTPLARCTAIAASLAACCTLAANAQSLTSPPLRIHAPAGDSTTAVQFQPQDIQLEKGAKPGISSIALVGSVEDAGLYLVRVRMEARSTNAAHVHPDARVTTVMSGTILYGIGDTADRTKAKPFGPGSVYFTPAGTPHFLMTGDEPATYEEAGVGPSKSTAVSSGQP